MTTAIQRILGTAPARSSAFSTRRYGTSKAEAAAQAAAATGASYTTGGSAAAATVSNSGGRTGAGGQLP